MNSILPNARLLGLITRSMTKTQQLNHLSVRCKSSGINLDRMDHLVLTVANIDKTVKFYTGVLGMHEVEVNFKGARFKKALHYGPFGHHKINLHEAGKEFEPKAGAPTPGSADLCFIAHDQSITDVVKHLELHKITIEEGPVGRTGATGPITSVYFRDPDNNLIEVAVYDEIKRFTKSQTYTL